MGMPLYSRVWYYDGTTLKSSAMGVAATANYIADHNMTMTWDEKLGQNYGEYTQDGVTYQLWQEDASSIEEKLKCSQSMIWRAAPSGSWVLTTRASGA